MSNPGSTMELGDRIRQGTKWLFTGTVGGRMIQFLFNIALARILVPSDFGMLVTIQIFTGLAGYFSGAGMGQALVQVKNLEDSFYNIVFTIQLIIGVMLVGIFWVIAPAFASFFENDLYAPLLRVSSLSFLWRPLATVQSAKLQREMRFREISMARISSQVLAGGVTVALALWGFGVWGLIFGGIVNGILLILALFRFSNWQPGIAFEVRTGKQLGLYGFKVTANGLLNHFGQHIDNLFVSKILGANLLGLYNKGYSLSELPKEIISKSTYSVLFRAFSKEQGNLNLSRYLYYTSIKIIMLYSAPVFVGLWWISDPLVHFLYGDKWMGAVPIIKILMILGVFRCIGNVSGAVIEAQNRLGKEFFIFLQSLIILVLGCYIFAKHGIIFVALIVVLRTLYATVRIVKFSCGLLQARIWDVIKSAAPGIIFSLVMVASLYFENILFLKLIQKYSEVLYLIATSISGALIYILLCLIVPVSSISNEVDKWKAKMKQAIYLKTWIKEASKA